MCRSLQTRILPLARQTLLPQSLPTTILNTSNHTPSLPLRNKYIKLTFCLFRIRTRRARPLIQNKCEECVVARQKVPFSTPTDNIDTCFHCVICTNLCVQCTWSTSADSCDRCRRLDKKCRARESSSSTPMGYKDDDRTMTPEAGIQPLNDLSGISQSTASAALALTALARNDERIVAEPVIIPKHSPTSYAPPIPHPNVYSVQGTIQSVLILLLQCSAWCCWCKDVDCRNRL